MIMQTQPTGMTANTGRAPNYLRGQHRQHSIHRRSNPIDARRVQTYHPAAPSVSRSGRSNPQTDTDTQAPFNPTRGEQAMWRAVITQAFMDARSLSHKEEMRSHRIKARQWLCGMSDDFRRICEYAGLDPTYVRQKARRLLGL